MALHASGYALSQGLISRMGYAVHRLLPLLPLALNSGMGRPQILRIRALDRAGLNIWNKHGLDEQDFDQVFATLCRRYDASEWDIGLLRDAIEKEIAEQSEASLQVVRVEIQAQLAGRELIVPELEDDVCENEKDTVMPIKVSDPPSVGGDARVEPQIDLERPEINTIQNSPAGDASGDPAALGNLSSAPSTEEISQTVEPKLATVDAGPNDLKSLRGKAWTLAARLAQRNGIGDLVVPLPDKGLGFILSDVPAPVLADQLDDDTLSQVSMVWWHLAASAEMTVAPVESIVSLLPPDSVLRQALKQQDAGLLFNSVWTLDPGHTGYRLWRRLGEQDWSDLLNLMDTYRQIHHLVEETATKIWE
ncbi:MAG: chromosome partitioning protein ParB [Gammaproteobacteria bacterium]|nr:chromosome partitioning protein ParB [Gammaproteobacteria bacterium]